MTSSSSNLSSTTVKPLSPAEREAWAAQNRAEEEERRRRFGGMSFAEKLHALESQGRLLAQLAARAAQRRT